MLLLPGPNHSPDPELKLNTVCPPTQANHLHVSLSFSIMNVISKHKPGSNYVTQIKTSVVAN